MKKYRVIYDLNDLDPPKKHELHAARIIARYSQSDLFFVRKATNSTPDFKVIKTGQVWELKSPLGNGKRTMANNIRGASHQSKNVIIDLYRCKMNNNNALAKIKGFLKSGDAHIDRLLIIDKSEKILDYSNNKK